MGCMTGTLGTVVRPLFAKIKCFRNVYTISNRYGTDESERKKRVMCDNNNYKIQKPLTQSRVVHSFKTFILIAELNFFLDFPYTRFTFVNLFTQCSYIECMLFGIIFVEHEYCRFSHNSFLVFISIFGEFSVCRDLILNALNRTMERKKCASITYSKTIPNYRNQFIINVYLSHAVLAAHFSAQ